MRISGMPLTSREPQIEKKEETVIITERNADLFDVKTPPQDIIREAVMTKEVVAKVDTNRNSMGVNKTMKNSQIADNRTKSAGKVVTHNRSQRSFTTKMNPLDMKAVYRT